MNKKLQGVLVALPLVTLASMAHAAADLSALDDTKSDLTLAGGALLAVVLLVYGVKKVAGMFGR